MKALLVGVACLAGFAGRVCLAAEGGADGKLTAPKEPPVGLSHHTYTSRYHPDIARYSLYIPPQYATNLDARFPVVYSLHGGRNDERSFTDRATMVDKEIRAGRLPPLIMVFPNGGHRTMYMNFAGGRTNIESMVIEELIPSIDKTYRTIRHRWGRGIEGLSMGGFASSRLGITYPELFCSAVPYAGCGVYRVDQMPSNRVEQYRRLLGEDRAKWRMVLGEELVERNRKALAGRTGIRIVVGEKDDNVEDAGAFHAILQDQHIDHDYVVVKGLGHWWPAPDIYLEGIRFHLDWFRRADALSREQPAGKRAAL